MIKEKINVGTEVKFYGDRNWWRARAADDRFVVLTRQREFKKAGEVVYTIIDWTEGVRGPCNLLGGGWNFNADTLDADAAELLRALNRRLETEEWFKDKPVGTTREITEREVEVSHRNRVDIEITDTRS